MATLLKALIFAGASFVLSRVAADQAHVAWNELRLLGHGDT